jgi:alpha-L-rhamnosidase
MRRIAEALGREDDARRYARLAQRIGRAFEREFVTPAGRVGGCTQTGYLLALGFGLLGEPRRGRAIEHLVAAIADCNDHLSTGFVGTPLIAPVLTACGRTDVAYKVVMQETYPGWLYTMRQGATTMWERWNSWTRENGFGPVDMNSFNHYAYGAIGQWLYATVAGLDVDETAPGGRRFVIAPEPGGGLTWAQAHWQTLHGRASNAWRRKGRDLTL